MIGFSPDSNAIIFSGIDAPGLLGLRNTPGIDTSYSSVLSVRELPGQNDSIGFEREFAGLIITTVRIVYSVQKKCFKIA